jgi:hypothetical protein
MLGLAIPLLFRYLIVMNIQAILSIVLGGFFVVLLAAVLGLLTKSKKLFEILFFLLTYANLNKVPLLDYFGGLAQNNQFTIYLICIDLILLGLTFLFRKWQLAKE